MKKIFLGLSMLLFSVSCSSESDKLLGKWKNILRDGDLIYEQTCTYVENHTKTCNSSASMQSGARLKIEYRLTQEWHLKDSILIEKTIDATTTNVNVDGEMIFASNPTYQDASTIILSRFPKGETVSRKIVLHADSFDLHQSDGSVSTFTRVRVIPI